MSSRRSIVVISGTSPLAAEVEQIYRRRLADFDLHVIHEQVPALQHALAFTRRHLRRYGLWSVIDAFALRLVQAVLWRRPAAAPEPKPQLVVASVNDSAVIDYVARVDPVAIVLNITSLVTAETIAALARPIINVHNGINPRYRGAGNIWALAEDSLELVGVTVHEVDAGVDTGRRLGVAPLDPAAKGIRFNDIERTAFRVGAEMVADHLSGKPLSIPDRFRNVLDRWYPTAGLSTWLRARRNYRRARQSTGLEDRWRGVFKRFSQNSTLSVGEQMLWGRPETLGDRDKRVRELLVQHGMIDKRVLDVGCGDGRYAEWIKPNYVGCDYTPEFLEHAKERPGSFVVADARALPFPDGSFDAAIAVGLLQHIGSAQAVVDEIVRVVRPGGLIVLDTLRRPSILALIGFALKPPWSRQNFMTAWAAARDVPSPEHNIARRYRTSRLLAMIGPRAGKRVVRYDEDVRFFAREVTVAVERIATAREKTLAAQPGAGA